MANANRYARCARIGSAETKRSERVYERVHKRSDVRVVLRDGGLRMQWFYVVPLLQSGAH
jgi:hypothetical protein